ncbi:MAG: nitroreductase family protein [Clostridiales bacterium]|nr:nitroreductase family protein [Clostridiales bacterium]
MGLQQIEELFLERQSCRDFIDRDVPDEIIEEICRVALLAPSACNCQPWKIVAVKGEKKDSIVKCVQGMGMNKFVDKAPVLIALVEGKGNFLTNLGDKTKHTDFVHNDIGVLQSHLVLAAHGAGLGTCILGWRNEREIGKVLGLGKNVKIPVMIALGYPPENYPIRPKKRKPLSETYTLIK